MVYLSPVFKLSMHNTRFMILVPIDSNQGKDSITYNSIAGGKTMSVA